MPMVQLEQWHNVMWQKRLRMMKMGGGRMMYGHGGHASIADMEKACNKMAGYNESLTKKG